MCGRRQRASRQQSGNQTVEMGKWQRAEESDGRPVNAGLGKDKLRARKQLQRSRAETKDSSCRDGGLSPRGIRLKDKSSDSKAGKGSGK
jgi:hypothetical protein